MTARLLLAIIIVLGLFLRSVNISNNPPSLYGDELTIALDSFSILKTGHDQLGNFLPLTFPMGAGRPAGYVYGTVPFIAIFGPTALGVRVLSMLSGVGIILLLFLIGRTLFSQKVGLLAAVIGAISPWDIALSRGGFESHFALFLALLGTYLFLLSKKKPMLYILSALSFGLTLHTYPTYKVSLLFFLPLLFWHQSSLGEILNSSKKYFLIGIIILVVLGILSLSQTFLGGSEARFLNINIFSQNQLKESIKQKINFESTFTELPQPLSKYFHNKPIEYAKVLLEHYLQNFSIDFLVLHGDKNPRHNMSTMGEIYFIEWILIFIGILRFWAKQKKSITFLVLWIILAPIPAAIIDLPHALRSALMLPPLILLAALGWQVILESRNKLLFYVAIITLIIQLAFFIQKIFFLAPNEYSNFWSYPAKLAANIAKSSSQQYNYIIISDKITDIEYAYPLYAKITPDQIIEQNKNGAYLNGRKFKKYDNVYIGFIPEEDVNKFLGALNASVLYLGLPTSKNNLKSVNVINGLDGQEAVVLERISP